MSSDTIVDIVNVGIRVVSILTAGQSFITGIYLYEWEKGVERTRLRPIFLMVVTMALI